MNDSHEQGKGAISQEVTSLSLFYCLDYLVDVHLW